MRLAWSQGRGQWLLAAWALAGCGFSVSAVTPDATDAPIDTPDAALPPLPTQWAVVNVLRSSAETATFAFDSAGFTPSCGDHVTPITRFLLGHPTLPYVYAASGSFEGLAVSCAGVTESSLGSFGGQRPSQRIVVAPSTSVGFFSADGAGALGLYRFTIAGDGTPTLGGSANGPSISGPIALDASTGELYIAGQFVVWRYQLLNGAALDLPGAGTHTNAPGSCTDPVDLAITGPYVLAFCSDSNDIRRFTRSPWAFDSTVGVFGAADRVATIPGDRAIAARISPPALVVVNLGGGTPTWGMETPLPSRIVAMAVAPDGGSLVTARQVDATTAELAAYQVVGDRIYPIGTQTLLGTVRSVALTAPGT